MCKRSKEGEPDLKDSGEMSAGYEGTEKGELIQELKMPDKSKPENSRSQVKNLLCESDAMHA